MTQLGSEAGLSASSNAPLRTNAQLVSAGWEDVLPKGTLTLESYQWAVCVVGARSVMTEKLDGAPLAPESTPQVLVELAGDTGVVLALRKGLVLAPCTARKKRCAIDEMPHVVSVMCLLTKAVGVARRRAGAGAAH